LKLQVEFRKKYSILLYNEWKKQLLINGFTDKQKSEKPDQYKMLGLYILKCPRKFIHSEIRSVYKFVLKRITPYLNICTIYISSHW